LREIDPVPEAGSSTSVSLGDAETFALVSEMDGPEGVCVNEIDDV
jgi:hypothetical protein